MQNRPLPYLASAVMGALLYAAAPSVLAFDFQFFEATKDGVSLTSDGGFEPYGENDGNHDNIDTRNAWLTAIGGSPAFTPDYMVGFEKDWNGNNWTGDIENDVFDIDREPTAIFNNGTMGAVKFSNNVDSDSDYPAAATDSASKLGGTEPLGDWGWRGRNKRDDGSGVHTMEFLNGVNYAAFVTGDTGSPSDNDNLPILYTVTFADNTTMEFDGRRTKDEHYRFTGFFSEKLISSIAMDVGTKGSKFLIDNVEYGKNGGNGNQVPEPGTVWLLSAAVGLALYRRRGALSAARST